MSIQRSIWLVLLTMVAAVLMSSNARAGGVRIVDASGQRNFSDIQSAIAAAVDGDVLLVGAGAYAGFTLDGKSLSILAVPSGAQRAQTGNIIVSNVTGNGVVICGLSAGELTIANCTSYVGIQNCAFVGGNSGTAGHRCALVQTNRSVVLIACTFVGGSASACVGCEQGYHGGAGLDASASTVAAYACSFRGGHGGFSVNTTGDGANGLQLDPQSWCFATECVFVGGDAGHGAGCFADGTWCGIGGDGVYVANGSEFHELANSSSGGSSGDAGFQCCGGFSGYSIECGPLATCDSLRARSRSFETSFLSIDRAAWTVSMTGIPDDQVFLNRSLLPVFAYEPTLRGVCTSVLPPFAQVAPLGTVPPSGQLEVAARQQALPSAVVARLNYLQGYVVDSGGATVLGSPMHVLSINWDSPPDCNGNGINDYAEVILGITPDVNHDLIPDSCPPPPGSRP